MWVRIELGVLSVVVAAGRLDGADSLDRRGEEHSPHCGKGARSKILASGLVGEASEQNERLREMAAASGTPQPTPTHPSHTTKQHVGVSNHRPG